MKFVALDIEITDLRPEHYVRKFHVLGSDSGFYVDGRWGISRTLDEMRKHAAKVTKSYLERGTEFRVELAGYRTLGGTFHPYTRIGERLTIDMAWE